MENLQSMKGEGRKGGKAEKWKAESRTQPLLDMEGLKRKAMQIKEIDGDGNWQRTYKQ